MEENKMLSDNGFYTIEKIEGVDDAYRLTVLLNPDHDVYKGHFPGHPVVPGVCSLQMIKEGLSAATGGRKFQYRTISNCKFLMMINPAAHPRLVLAVTVGKTAGQLLDIQADIRIEGEVALKLKATLVEIG